MQGKEASEQETKAKSSVGIDVSKCWLDVHVLAADQRLRVANSCAGIRQFKRWLSRFDIALVAIEATGKWHRQLHRSLVASAIPVAVIDPYRVRMFAKAQGILAKTDRLDARVLAAFAAMMNPSVRAPAPQTMTELAELVVARASAVETQAALKHQHGAAEANFLKRQLERRIGRAAKDIAELEGEILKRIKADDALARRYAILTSIPALASPPPQLSSLASLRSAARAPNRSVCWQVLPRSQINRASVTAFASSGADAKPCAA
jgi:transposase